jgi:hypothetical protein
MGKKTPSLNINLKHSIFLFIAEIISFQWLAIVSTSPILLRQLFRLCYGEQKEWGLICFSFLWQKLNAV